MLLLAVACGAPVGSSDDSGESSPEGPVNGPGDQPDDRPDDTAGPAPGEPVGLFINELMPANNGSVEVAGEFPDWVELYNPGEAEVALDGFTITDDLDEPTKHPLDPSLVVPAGGFLLLYADSGDGALHLGFKLSGDGESIGLYFPDGSPADALQFGVIPDNLSLARTPDGGEDWVTTTSPTPGAENDID